jgi:glycosyltransferase involved in cell wall biosynthesis
MHVRYIDDDEEPLFFSASDVCILPYKSATQSGITAISFHFEVPMIATDVGGLKEIIHHNETGLIVPKPEASMIAESIKQFFEPGNRTIFIENIRKMKSRLSWTSLAKSIEQLYNSLKFEA